MRMPRTLGVSLAALVVSSPAVTKQAHSADYSANPPAEHASKAKPGETNLTQAAERRHGTIQLAAATAALIRNFPATLSVHVSERTPLVRVQHERLASRP